MANKKKRENGKVQKNIAKVFLIMLVLFLVGNLLIPTKSYSEKERQYLTEKPKLAWNAVWTGTYMEEYETYLTDQFMGKAVFRNLTAPLGRISGNSAVNGIYYGKQKQLMEDIVMPEDESLQETLQAISEFAQENVGVETSMLIIPDAAEIWSEKLPFFTETVDQASLIKRVEKSIEDSVTFIDVSDIFEDHADEKLYYQTDYHWTSLGAYYAFQASTEALEIPAEGLSDFVSYSVTKKYTGALAARSGYLENLKEDISIYVPGGRNVEVVVNYIDEGKKRTSLFNSEELDGKDKYQVFLGKESPLVDIKTTADSDSRILIFKDSSANSFVQFLIPYYREIILVDTELYDGKASELLRTYQVSDVLFLYRGNTFFGENQLSGVLTGE